MLISMMMVVWNNSNQELSRKSMRKSKMRNKGKDPSCQKKWVEIGKYVGKVVYFDTFSTNITLWLHKTGSKDT